MTTARVQAIRDRLASRLAPLDLVVEDESHLHAGHAGAKEGKGHFRVRIVSTEFGGQGRLARHRLIYEAMDELMQTDIHALSIQALTPEEARSTDQETDSKSRETE